MDRWKDGQMDIWKDGQKDGWEEYPMVKMQRGSNTQPPLINLNQSRLT